MFMFIISIKSGIVIIISLKVWNDIFKRFWFVFKNFDFLCLCLINVFII